MNDSLASLPNDRRRLLNRSTGGEFTPLAYLNIIERGSEGEWALLYNECMRNPETRTTVIALLEMGDPLQAGIIRLWADLLGAPWPKLEDPVSGL